MKTKTGLTLALLMTLSYSALGGIATAYADDIRWYSNAYDDSRGRDDDRSYGYHHGRGYDRHDRDDHWSRGNHGNGDRGWHNGFKQDVVYLQPNRAARYQTIYYSSHYPRAIATRYSVGEYLPRHTRCEEPPRSVVAVLPPVSRGTQYVQVDRDVYLVSEATKQILDAVVLLSGVR